MDKDTELPPIDKNLLGKLNELFPEKSADLEWEEKEIWYKAGQRSVIHFLQQTYKDQQEE